MCGIGGILLREPARLDEARSWGRSLIVDLGHRGPDGEGLWSAPSHGLLFGHTRLAVIDLSEAASQPMLLAHGRIDDEKAADPLAIVYNGEIYNHIELRTELEQLGERFQSHSDTEVLLRGYLRWGEAVLDRIVGMFAFAVWDPDRGGVFLARDRAGEKPLYYAETPLGFAFASELKPLLRLPGVDAAVDLDAASLYLQYQYVPPPYTLHRGIRKLPPAHCAWIRVHGFRERRYWDLASIAGRPTLEVDTDEASGRLTTLIEQSVRGQLVSDVPLGCLLSGGIDSSIVASFMKSHTEGQVRTFTIGFEYDEVDESPYAAAVARHLGTHHTRLVATEKDALELIPRLGEIYSEPFADPSAVPTLLVSRLAREHVTVALTGDGADETFGGYDRYAWVRRAVPLAKATGLLIPPFLRHTLGKRTNPWGRRARLIGVSPAEVHRRSVSYFDTHELLELTGRSPALHEFDRAWNQDIHWSQSVRLAEFLTYLPGAPLTKVDRAAMSVSLETRAPLLDHRILEYAFRLPRQFVTGKSVLKAVAYKRIPRHLIERPKSGFGIPVHRWLRGHLKDILVDTLQPGCLEAIGVVRPGIAQRYVREHMLGRDHGYRLWALLMLVFWFQSQGKYRCANP